MLVKGGLRIAAIALALSLAGCTDPARAPELAKAGVAASSALASYYDSLVETTIEYWDLETFFSVMNGVEMDKEDEKPLLDRIEALRLRAGMARQLAGAYGAMANLAASQGGGSPDAAGRLGESLQTIRPLPGGRFDPAGLFRVAAGKLIGVRQSRDLRAGNEAMAETLESVRKLIEKEKPVYLSFGEERDKNAQLLTEELVKRRMTPIWPALERIAQLLKTPWQDQARLAQDERMTEAALALMRTQWRRAQALSERALDNLSRSLEGLAGRHRQMAVPGPVNLDDVLRAVQTAQADLDAIDKLRGTTK